MPVRTHSQKYKEAEKPRAESEPRKPDMSIKLDTTGRQYSARLAEKELPDDKFTEDSDKEDDDNVTIRGRETVLDPDNLSPPQSSYEMPMDITT